MVAVLLTIVKLFLRGQSRRPRFCKPYHLLAESVDGAHIWIRVLKSDARLREGISLCRRLLLLICDFNKR